MEDEAPALPAILRSFLERQRSACNLPSLSVAAVAAGGSAVACLGESDVEAGDEAGPATLYPIASITKLFTAVAILRLCDRGLLDLAVPVERYLPHFAGRGVFRAGRDMTLRHVLSHSAGLPLGPCSLVPYTLQECGRAALLADLAGHELVFPVGARFKYSNLGYVLAAEVIQEVTGRSYHEVIEEEILRPLAMGRSVFGYPRDRCDGVAAGYHRDPYRALIRPGDPLVRAAPAGSIVGAGDLRTTPVGMARFLAALLAALRGDETLLSAGAARELQKSHVRIDGEAASGYGFGLIVLRRRGLRCLLHRGAGEGFSSFLALLPEAGLGAVALTNRCWAQVELQKIVYRVFDHFLDEAAGGGAAGLAPQRPWERLAGVFRAGESVLEVEPAGPRLRCRIDGEPVALQPREGLSFLQQGGPCEEYLLRFAERDGEVAEATAGPRRFIRQGREDAEAESVSGWSELEGRYGIPGFGQAEVYRRGERLYFALTPAVEIALEPAEGRTFSQSKGPFAGEPLRFYPAAGGRAAALAVGCLRFERGRDPLASGAA